MASNLGGKQWIVFWGYDFLHALLCGVALSEVHVLLLAGGA